MIFNFRMKISSPPVPNPMNIKIKRFFFLFTVLLTGLISWPAPVLGASQTLQTVTPSSTIFATPARFPTPTGTTLARTPTTITPTPSPLHLINIKGHSQRLSIDCEASAAVDWAAYYGITIDELEFQSRIPLSDNPNEGFVGSVKGTWGQLPPLGYGVYANPIASLLNSYGLPAIAVKNASFDWMINQLSQGNPVLVWVIGRLEKSKALVFTDKLGRQYTAAPYEHVVIMMGYNDKKEHIFYLSEGKLYEAPYQNLIDSWAILGNMAVAKK
jgi:uncharacterized protein YvpB